MIAASKSLFLIAIVGCLVALGSAQTMTARLHYFNNDQCTGIEQSVIPMYEGNNTLCAVQTAPTCELTFYGMNHQAESNASCGITGVFANNATSLLEVKSTGPRYLAYGACTRSTRFPGCYFFYETPSYQYVAPSNPTAAPHSAASSLAVALPLLASAVALAFIGSF